MVDVVSRELFQANQEMIYTVADRVRAIAVERKVNPKLLWQSLAILATQEAADEPVSFIWMP